MKKTTITLIFILAFARVFSVPNHSTSSEYVETESGIIFVKNLKYGISNFIVAETEEGVKLSLKKMKLSLTKKKGRYINN